MTDARRRWTAEDIKRWVPGRTMIQRFSYRGAQVVWLNLGVILVSDEEILDPVLELMQLTEERRTDDSSPALIERTRVPELGSTSVYATVRFASFNIPRGAESPEWTDRCWRARLHLESGS